MQPPPSWTPVAAWVPCPDCDDYWCNIHGEHAYDCDCPGIEEWAEIDLSPYETVMYEQV